MILFLLGLFFQSAGQDGVLHDVLIHEIFADPTPSNGLPNAEFIEIRNRSEKTINLRNWILTNGTTLGKIISNIGSAISPWNRAICHQKSGLNGRVGTRIIAVGRQLGKAQKRGIRCADQN